MYLEFPGVRIHISFFFAAALAFAVNSGRGRAVAVVFMSALVHECAHIFFLRRWGAGDLSVSLYPGGARISGGGWEALPYGAAAVAALAGPAVNFLLSGGCFRLFSVTGAALFREAAAVNLSLGALNLLPLSFLDGGRVLRSLLAGKQKKPAPLWLRRGVDLAVILLLAGLAVALTAMGRDALFFLLFALYCALRAFSPR